MTKINLKKEIAAMTKKQDVETNYQLKEKYNELLAREAKASKYFDDKTIPWQKKEKHIPQYNDLIKEMETIECMIGNFTEEERLYGFEL